MKHLPWNIGFRYVRSRQPSLALVTRFSIIGFALAIGVLYLVQMLVSGFQAEMEYRMLSVYPHISLHHSENIEPTKTLDEITETNDEVVAWSAGAFATVAVAGTEELVHVQALGVDPQTFTKVSDLQRFSTTPLEVALVEREFGVMVGEQIANSLQIAVGDPIHVYRTDLNITPLGLLPVSKQFTVTAIVDTDSVLDNQLIYMHKSDLGRLFRLNSTGNRYFIRVTEPLRASRIVYEVAQILRNQDSFFAGVTTWANSMGLQYRFLRVMENVFFLLLSLLVAVASFNLVSTMVMLVHERRGDIAILRTFGGKTWLLTSTFIVTAGVLALVGLTLGALLSWVGGLLLEWSFPSLARAMDLDMVDVVFLKAFEMRFELTDFLKVFFLGGGLAMLAAAFPAYKVAKLLPADILRYE